ncbi:MAG: agmatine deiminase family protein, partial [Bdellovibrionales bacterium]|nr:agmatine deiminase family protein [Bdellovibrionales bacterium]
SASAEEIPQGYTPEQEARIVQHNSLMTQALRQAWQEAGRKGISDTFREFVKQLYLGGAVEAEPEGPAEAALAAARVTRPVAEFERAGSLFFSSGTDFGSAQAKSSMLRNLPEGVTAVVFTKYDSELDDTRRWVAAEAPDARVEVVNLSSSGNSFWARDHLPIPVWVRAGEGPESLGVVDARYYHGYEADRQVADGFGAPIFRHDYYFDGGNFVVDGEGNCFVVATTMSNRVPDSVFSGVYGCATTTRLRFVAGIGHVDEHVKFLSASVAVTDVEYYAELLRSRGYDVRMLPDAGGGERTYVNSLLVNGTIFMPAYQT